MRVSSQRVPKTTLPSQGGGRTGRHGALRACEATRLRALLQDAAHPSGCALRQGDCGAAERFSETLTFATEAGESNGQ